MANYPSNERQLEEIWKEGWHFTIRDQCPFERFEKAEFAAGMDFTIHSGIYSIERYSGTCCSKRGKPCRSIRPRKVFGKCSQKVSFIVRCIVFLYPKKLPILLPFSLFSFFSPYFFSRIRRKEIFESRSESFPQLKNRCFESVFSRKAEKRTERKKQIEGKRFHRRIGRVRNVFVYNIPGRIGVLFTLRGIHSSPVKRVKTQKSESLFVTSFDVAINSFEITACAGRTGPNIRQQPDPVLLSKIQISNKSPPPPQIYVLYSVPRRVSPRYMFG